jgi:CBS domain-containing protein
MNANDIMTRSVVTISPDTMLADAAALLAQHRISGLPVVEKGRVVGLVSESDLLQHRELGARNAKQPWWAAMFLERPDPLEYVKAHAVRAQDVMTRRVVSVAEDTPAAKVAALLDKRRIRRVPVLREERLVGIVTRADLVRSMGLTERKLRLRSSQSDDRIRALLLEELEAQPWWNSASYVEVTRGVVRFWGICYGDDAREAARVAAENIAGVRRVEDDRVDGGRLLSMME